MKAYENSSKNELKHRNVISQVISLTGCLAPQHSHSPREEKNHTIPDGEKQLKSKSTLPSPVQWLKLIQKQVTLHCSVYYNFGSRVPEAEGLNKKGNSCTGLVSLF